MTTKDLAAMIDAAWEAHRAVGLSDKGAVREAVDELARPKTSINLLAD